MRNWFYRNKNIIIIITTIAILLLFIFFRNIVFKDPTIAGLVGALIGGSCSIIGASYSFSSDVKAKSYLSKAEKIYEPLYNELFKYNLKDNKNKKTMPIIFLQRNEEYSKYNSLFIYNHLNYIHEDSCYLTIPSNIKIKFDNFFNSISAYDEAKEKVDRAIGKKKYIPDTNEAWKKIYINPGAESELIFRIVTDINFNSKDIDFERYFTHASDMDNPNTIINYYQIILKDIQSLEEIKNLRESYNKLIDDYNDFFEVIKNEIDYINLKYKK